MRNDIITLMNNLKEEYTPENQYALLNALFKETVFIPTTEVPVQGVAKPIPVAISTADGRLFQPAFLDESDVDEKAKETYITTMEFAHLADVVLKQNEMYKKRDKNFKLIDGIVINPSLQATVISTKVLALYMSSLSPQKMTEEQHTLFARCRFEQWILPSAFFKKGEEFIKVLLQGKEKFVNDMFAQSYESNFAYPYTAEDFKIIAMNPAKDGALVKIEFPEKNFMFGTAECAYLVIKKENDEKHFLAVVKEPGEEAKHNRVLVEIGEDMKANRIGVAPEVGNEVGVLADFFK